ncbi:addiction module component [Oceanisphaera profunda]|uniref:Addiction module component n=1 Tax=Oceanisphaera profunda TaxID=1416627 RepID=A0A1Y0D7X7_9GAMM|nr:addiction module component [Oceanisphaera profunda]ART83649.1 addiction module component [Oceanisphaera profunda]
MKQLLLLTFTAALLSACAGERHYPFALGQTVKDLDEIQIMDPEAASRNDGKISALALNGEYGVSLHDKYVKSAEPPSKGKTQVTLNFAD